MNFVKRKISGREPDPSESRLTETNDVPNSSPVDDLDFSFGHLRISDEARKIPVPPPRIRSKGRAVVISDSPPSPRVSAVIPRSPSPENFRNMTVLRPNVVKGGYESVDQHLWISDEARKNPVPPPRTVVISDGPPRPRVIPRSHPPEDFRNITVVPKFEELIDLREPYLKPNVVEGGYERVHHCRDVHFRLLREDFDKPLRKDIRRYQEGSIGSSEVPLPRIRSKDHTVVIYDGRPCPRIAAAIPRSHPPEDFRNMTIIPKFKELIDRREPYLRPNVVEGGYKSVDHYLDVHFRLLREDFVRPLREGIRQYREGSTEPSEVRLYGGVRIADSHCQSDGAIHTVSFDPGTMKTTEWEESKRLAFGSLVCLSGDKFRTALMATVAESKPWELAKGVVHVRLEDCQMPKFHRSETFVMLENTAFFEAYRHVLACLMAADSEGFPFREAIVFCKRARKPPKYLSDPGARSFVLLKTEKAKLSESIDVLNRHSWPTASSLGLDESQIKALHHCLTSELAIVQGPPGTGKTFLGLKVVETLLANWHRWNKDGSPILIVCYTNHALDQFLEGILKFLKTGVIRVGGRSQCPALDQFNLKKLRELSKMKRNGIRKEMDRLRRKLRKLKATIDREEAKVKDPHSVLVGDKSLHLLENFSNGLRQHKELNETLKSLRLREDERILREAKVVGMTTTGAARNREMLSILRPKIVVVEEAAEVLESHIVASLNPGCQHLVLIGDHEQLRPSVHVHELETEFLLNCSLFERLVKNGHPFVSLERQHRMRPEISCFARITYDFLKDAESVWEIDLVRGVAHNVFFVNHDRPESQNFKLVSSYNTHEASFLARLCRYLIQQGYSGKQITILSPYKAQTGVIQDCLQRLCLREVHVCPIDGYQGEENDIVLLSLVRSNHSGKIGFLKESNRLNVAMTRAKRGLYVVGNFDMLKTKSEFVRKIYDLATKRQSPVLGPKLPLRCQNHPGVVISVSTAEDFDLVPEGGCSERCNFSLPCGHHCRRTCHPDDRDHMNSRCEVISRRIVLKCGHENRVKCREKQSAKECKVIVTMTFPCGHSNQLFCYEADDPKVSCRMGCSREFNYGHPYAGRRPSATSRRTYDDWDDGD